MLFIVLAAPSWFARAVGVESFRLFDVKRPCSSVWKEVAIRIAASFAPLVFASGLFVLASLIGGEPAATTTLEVRPGPAKEAGLEDGDRILDIDGRAVADWEEILSAIRAKRATHEIVVERGGARTTFSVTPNAEGRVGIVSRLERRDVSWDKALRTGFAMPFRVMAETFLAATQSTRKVELTGPVGIVRETAKAKQGGFGASLSFLAMLVAYVLPAFPIMHLLDAGSLFAFRRKYRVDGNTFPNVTLATWRIARLRQVLNGLLIFWLALIPLALVVTFVDGIGPMPMLPYIWFSPILFPLTWLLASSLSGPVKGALYVVALAIPFLNLLSLVHLSGRAGAYMNENGLGKAGLPQPPSPAA
jgi:hypothetical protein